jgi:hypothetical protein
MAVTVGGAVFGSRTVKLKLLDPPPGAGLVTTTGNVPVLVRSDANSPMVSSPASNGVVTGWGDPPKVTVELDRKFLPRIESAGGLAPTAAAEGVMLVTCGWGLDAVPELT